MFPVFVASAVLASPLLAVRPKLDSICESLHGRMGYCVIDLRTGERISHRGEERFPSASTIKLAIAVEAMRQVDAGKLKLTDKREVPPIADRKDWEVSQWTYYLKEGVKPDLDGWISLMIGVSDNLAARVVREWVGVREANATFASLGLPNTMGLSSAPADDARLQRLHSQFGMGVTTPSEMAHLFELIYQRKAASAAACEKLIRWLSHQYWDDWIGVSVPLHVKVANKSGAIDRSRSDVAMVFAEHPYVLAIYTDAQKDHRYDWDNEGHLAIVKLAREVYKALNPGESPDPAEGYIPKFLPTGGGE